METSLSGIKKTAQSAAAASAGGRNSIALRDNRQTLQRKTVSSSSSAEVAQLIKVSSGPGNAEVRRKKDTTKLAQALKHLRESLEHIDSPKISEVKVQIDQQYGANPASTWKNGKIIRVHVAHWFLRQASVGDLVGMLSHEIGVHTLADDQLNRNEKIDEDRQLKHPYQVRVGRHTHTIGGWSDRKKDWPRQRDHIIVARDSGTVRPQLVHKSRVKKDIHGRKLPRKNKTDIINRRAEAYAQTMLRLGDRIEKDHSLDLPERNKRLHDLLNSFLLDYARIIVTNDNLLWAAPKSFLIAQVFNWYKTVIIARHGDKHKWLKRKEMLPTASGWGVRAYLLGKIGRILLENALITKPAQFAQTQYYKGEYYGGKVLGAISSGLSAITPGFVSNAGGRVAAKVGSYYTSAKNALSSGYSKVSEKVGPGLRTFDHVYGEVESPFVSGSEKILRGAYNVAQWGWNKINPWG